MNPFSPQQFLRELFNNAVNVVSAEKCLPDFLPLPPRGKTLVIGAGKAAAAMAKVVEENWTGELSGLVVTRYGHGANCKKIAVVEAAHPVPDEAGHKAATRILDFFRNL